MTVGGKTRTAQRALRTELACARALLDGLEAVLDGEHEEPMQRAVVGQMADQLGQLASAMKSWNPGASENEALKANHENRTSAPAEAEHEKVPADGQ